ncbi:hypothetical protein GCM10027072_73430 [Streptomyces bullii]
MPAITVDDVLVLPRLPELDPAGTAYRSVRRLTSAQHGFEGEGFPVRRAFAGVPPPKLDPFVHMDHVGEMEQAPGEPQGTPWHPHRGLRFPGASVYRDLADIRVSPARLAGRRSCEAGEDVADLLGLGGLDVLDG